MALSSAGGLIRFGRGNTPAFLFSGLALGPPPRDPRFAERLQIGTPALLLFRAQFMQVLPGKQPRVMSVVKHQAYGVVADRFNRTDAHRLFSRNQEPRGDTVPGHFSRGRIDAQILRRQRKTGSIVEADFQQTRPGTQANLDRGGYTHPSIPSKAGQLTLPIPRI